MGDQIQVVHLEEEAEKQEATGPDTAQRNGTASTTTAAEGVIESTVRKRIEITVLSLVIVTVWGLLALPTVLYITEPSQDSDISPSNNRSNTDNGTSNVSTCFPEVYIGSVCGSRLQAQQACLQGNTSREVFIPASQNQEAQEQTAQILIDGLQLLNPSPECSEVAPLFLCFSVFGLCDNHSRELYRPSSGECEAVTEETCNEEFITARSILDPSLLPQCQWLPDTPTMCTGHVPETNTTPEARVCNDGFYLDGICRPECGVWEAFSYGTYVPIDVITIMLAAVFFIGATVLMSLSCIRYKQVFKFPSVFSIYGTVTIGVLELFLLIGYFHRSRLFCTSRDLVESIKHTTPYCILQGMVFTYTLVLLSIFFFFHILSVFWAVMFPFHARSFERKGYLKYVHFSMLFIALILPCVSVAAAFASGGHKRFPPIMCYPNSTDVVQYGAILPISIMVGLSLSLVVVILWRIIKLVQKRKKNKYGAKNVTGTQTVQMKVLIVFIYYIMIGVSLLVITFLVTNKKGISADLTEYFVCESVGVQPGKVCEKTFVRIPLEIAVNVGFVLLGLYPVVNLVYVVNVRAMKERWSTQRGTRQLRVHLTTSLSRLTSSTERVFKVQDHNI